ncbi:MAG TPA: hydroxymethylbilane synthase [Candidatus Methylomirabilis sp.]|nr:hydroxymethylbilane synthase [Candidatus Methylomirabilis sp.]
MSLEPGTKTLEPRSLVIGTRGSKLALWQAEHVAGRLRGAFPSFTVRLETIKTTGDKIQDVPLAQVGGKALFVKEIEEALLAGRVDLAVHSMKDVPTELPSGLCIAAVSEREDPLDVLISRTGASLAGLPRGGRVGTSSLRRQAQLLHHRPDLTIVGLRGNLDTRIRKLTDEGLDAIVVAAAGVRRLGLTHLITERLRADILLPAIGQGALGIEIRAPHPAAGSPERQAPSILQQVSVLDHPETHTAVRAERAMLSRLEGGCQVPIAAHATVSDGGIVLQGLVASLDGGRLVRGDMRGGSGDAEAMGAALAEDLLRRGAAEILREIYARG